MEIVQTGGDLISRIRAFVKKNNEAIAILVTIAYILGFGIYLFIASFEIGIRFHEIDSYALPVISIQYRGSLVMQQSDLLLAQRDFPAFYEGINIWEDLRSTKPMRSILDPDVWVAYYFPIYSIFCLPVKLVLQLFRLDQQNCFLITNVLLVIICFAVIMLCSKMPRWYRFAYIVLLSAAPLEQYTSYLSAEILIMMLMALSVMFYYDKAYCRAGILLSLASLANPTVLFFGLVMIANYIAVEVIMYYAKRKDLDKKQICIQGFCKLARLGVCYLIVFIPFILNFVHLGVVNGTLGGADLGEVVYRILMYFFDLNLGYISFSPLLTVLVLAGFVAVIAFKRYRLLWFYASFFVTVFAFSIMDHINCGMHYCARYVIWSYAMLAFLGVLLIYELKMLKALKPAFVASSFLAAILIMNFNSSGSVDFFTLNRASQTMLDKAPALYSPLHSTFNSRVNGLARGGYDLPSYTMYYDSETLQIRKILLYGDQAAKDRLLAECKAIIGDNNEFVKAVNKVPNDGDWHYISISPRKSWQVGLCDLTYSGSELYHTANALSTDNGIELGNGSVQFGPYCELVSGKYTVKVYGSGLLNAAFDVSSDNGTVLVPIRMISYDDGAAVFEIELENGGRDIEIRTYNRTDGTVTVKGIDIDRIFDAEQ